MYYWTIQKKEMVDKIMEKKIIYPKMDEYTGCYVIEKLYPDLIRGFNKLNNSFHRGLIFGIKLELNAIEEDKEIDTIDDFRGVIKRSCEEIADFDYWKENPDDYRVLKVKLTNDINPMPVIFNDLLNLNANKENYIDEKAELNKYMISGILNPFSKKIGFVQVHQPFIKEEDVIEIYQF